MVKIKNDNYKTRILSLDALRILFCITIVLNHCVFLKQSEEGKYIYEKIFHNGAFGVTFFFLVSAFLTYRIYSESGIKNVYTFLKKNVSKFYILYMVTHIVVATYLVINGASIIKTMLKLLLAATLMQSMTIVGATILNGACWYLSTLTVLYFFTPFIIHFVKSLNKKQVYGYSILMIAIIFCIHFLVNILTGNIISSQIAINLTYTFPIYWIPAYTLGMLANRWSFPDKVNSTVIEVICVIVGIVVYLLGINGPDFIIEYRNLAYVICILPIIYFFSKEEGIISRSLAKSKTTKIVSLTMEVYMIHYVVIICTADILERMSSTLVGGAFCVVIVFVITIMFSAVWKKFYRKIC